MYYHFKETKLSHEQITYKEVYFEIFNSFFLSV